jgi:hypothetical protein
MNKEEEQTINKQHQIPTTIKLLSPKAGIAVQSLFLTNSFHPVSLTIIGESV